MASWSREYSAWMEYRSTEPQNQRTQCYWECLHRLLFSNHIIAWLVVCNVCDRPGSIGLQESIGTCQHFQQKQKQSMILFNIIFNYYTAHRNTIINDLIRQPVLFGFMHINMCMLFHVHITIVDFLCWPRRSLVLLSDCHFSLCFNSSTFCVRRHHLRRLQKVA